MDLGLRGRRALVCGASAGIGRAIAAALVAEGAEVAVASRSRTRIDAAAEALGARGLVWDSAEPDRAAALVAAAAAALGGPLDVLVANTGGPPAGADPLGFSRLEWEAAHASLVLAPLALAAAALPAMRARGWGRLLNVASTSVREPIAHLMLSNAERAAALAAWKTLAREVAGDGVTVNTLLPGRILTDRLAGLAGSAEAAEASARAAVPARRTGRPEEIAAVAAFLCGEPAGYVVRLSRPTRDGSHTGGCSCTLQACLRRRCSDPPSGMPANRRRSVPRAAPGRPGAAGRTGAPVPPRPARATAPCTACRPSWSRAPSASRGPTRGRHRSEG